TYGDDVYLRGLIEFTNHCALDCQFCGIRRSNAGATRYRLGVEQIVELAEAGWKYGLKTFVLQGGEDPWFTADRLTEVIEKIQVVTQGQAALTLSVGIRPREVYARWKAAGADRYLMRFETSDEALYSQLKNGARLADRLRALDSLRDLGYEVGSGYMVGLPGETEETRIANALLCHEKDFDMVGIGPFIPHPDTPLAGSPQQPIDLAVRAAALVRLLLPQANMPATTAAGSLDKQGREKMLAAGANVLMPNITPESVKKDYLLYPGKICLDESGFECINCLDIRTHLVDKKLSWARGNSVNAERRGVLL
ncbi:MAG TPA: [FeFe] hydrogenase H-cluster radical SAM maturase HydE, partial [Spirochaetia bacterium]|nr:[FeFe] hydrogenase H-cluster radical SAM maturase HydE [Spirochaetia bacterium]